MNGQTYTSAGVNVVRADKFVERLRKSAMRPGHEALWPGAGGYAAVYPVNHDQAIALTTDGVGTKVLIAEKLGRYDTIGIDLVAMCANDLICVGAKPALFLDYFATGELNDTVADAILRGIIVGCDKTGMILVGGETAEMPDVYQSGHFDLAGFALGYVSKQLLITGSEIRPKQLVVGVLSSGLHSNGLSLARKVLSGSPEVLESLLVPTLLYVKPVCTLLDKLPKQVKGIAHITGGGWKNIFRLNPHVGYHIERPLPIPAIFQQIAEHVAEDEMYRTFNMGMGLCLVIDGSPEPVLDVIQSAGFTAQVVGCVTEQAKTLTIKDSEVVLKG